MVEILLHRGTQLVAVHPAGDHHLGRVLVVDQRDEQVLERRIFVAALARFAERVVEGLFEVSGETGHRGNNSAPAEPQRASILNVIWDRNAIKGRWLRLSPVYRGLRPLARRLYDCEERRKFKAIAVRRRQFCPA
jgi:hypothetical protein